LNSTKITNRGQGSLFAYHLNPASFIQCSSKDVGLENDCKQSIASPMLPRLTSTSLILLMFLLDVTLAVTLGVEKLSIFVYKNLLRLWD